MRLRVLLAGLLGMLMGPPPELAAAEPESPAESANLSAAAEDADGSRERHVGSKSDATPAAAKLALLLDVNDYIHRSAAGASAGRAPEEATLLAARAEALVEGLGEGAGEPLARLLAPLSPLDRTWTILCWTLSPRAPLRMAVARAALRPSDGVGLYSALEVLRNDSDPAVRSAACTALASAGTLRAPVLDD
jgi:hypothetical protein